MHDQHWKITGIESHSNGMRTASLSLDSPHNSHVDAIEVHGDGYDETINRAVACRDALNKGEVQ